MEVPVELTVVAGEYMNSATVLQWLKQPGEPVREGEILVLVETAKATMEVAAPVAGVLARTAYPAGADVPVGEVLGWIQTTPDPDARQGGSRAPGGRIAITPAARRLAALLGVSLSRLRPTRPDGRITEADVRAAAAVATSVTDDTWSKPPPTRSAGTPA